MDGSPEMAAALILSGGLLDRNLCKNMINTGFLLETIKRYYRIDRSEISYLRFILESYDGVGILTTVDPKAGIVVMRISPGCLTEATMIIDELKKEIMIEELQTPVYPMGIRYAGSEGCDEQR